MKDSTLLTLIISYYNVEKHIVSNIKSLKTQINADFHCILVDKGFSNKNFEYKNFHALEQLIFHNKKNPFQWNSLHVGKWRGINAKRQIFIPTKTHLLVCQYIALIKAHRVPAAKAVWNMLKLREKAK